MTITTGPAATLSVEPAALTRAAASFTAAADRVGGMIENARWALAVGPAMTDELSKAFAASAARHHAEGPGSLVQVLQRYRDELAGIATALEASARAYERVESDNAAALS